jgi:hypothetical protein
LFFFLLSVLAESSLHIRAFFHRVRAGRRGEYSL